MGRKKTGKKKGKGLGHLPDIAAAASATECTGLMPTPPADAAAENSYQQLSSMEIPRQE